MFMNLTTIPSYYWPDETWNRAHDLGGVILNHCASDYASFLNNNGMSVITENVTHILIEARAPGVSELIKACHKKGLKVYIAIIDDGELVGFEEVKNYQELS